MPEVQLQRALLLMENKEPAARAEAAQAIKEYIVAFETRRVGDARQSGNLPPNIDTLYDYLRLLGEKTWQAPPAESVRVVSSGQVAPASGPETGSVTPKRVGRKP